MLSTLRIARPWFFNTEFALMQFRQQTNQLGRFSYFCPVVDKESNVISNCKRQQIKTNFMRPNAVAPQKRNLFFDRLQFNSSKKDVKQLPKDPFTFELKTAPSPPPEPPPPPPPSVREIAKMTLWEKYKRMFRDYWYVLVPVHLVTSIVWFGTFYYMAQSGVDIISLLKVLGASEAIIEKMEHTGAGYVAIAYALYKIATPARYTVTLAGTTISVKYLAQWGLIKPAPSPAQFHQFLRVKGQLFFRRRRIRSKGKILKEKQGKQL